MDVSINMSLDHGMDVFHMEINEKNNLYLKYIIN